MALNFTFSGSIYDEDDNAIDCNYQLYYYRQNTISPIHQTENTQYNINAGEESHLGFAGELKIDDVVLIKFWNETNFCIYKFIYNGEDYTIQDIKILDSQIPTATMIVSHAKLGEEVNFYSNNSDEYQYDFSGTTLYHKASWYGFDLFLDRVGIDNIYYKIDAGTYSTDTSHTFDTHGEYEISVKVVNKYGLEYIDSEVIRVTKNAPYVSLSNLPLKPQKLEDTTITVNITDADTTIEDIGYLIDGVQTEDLTHNFDTIQTHSFEVGLIWNDGFDTYFLSKEILIEMTNTPPIVSISSTNTENTYTLSLDTSDSDGSVVSSRWEIYYILPFSNEEYKVYDEVVSNTQDKEFTFSSTGEYKIRVYVYDDIGDSSYADKHILITNSADIITVSNGINDDGGFEIVDYKISYFDIDGNVSSSYMLYDYNGDPTDTYIMSKVLETYSTSSVSVIDKRGGSKIENYQQIYKDIDGNESVRYDLLDNENNPTMSEIFKKVRVV